MNTSIFLLFVKHYESAQPIRIESNQLFWIETVAEVSKAKKGSSGPFTFTRTFSVHKESPTSKHIFKLAHKTTI